MKSLTYHSRLREGIRDDAPPPGLKEIILSTMEEMYKEAKWMLPGDFMEKTHFERVVKEKLDWNSSPGYPFLMRAPTNRILFKVEEGIPLQQEVDRMWLLLQNRLEERDADPVRLFVKPEPHKVKKLDSHRYRLISSVSVLDQIIDHMLFGELNQSLIDNWPFIPNRPGWSQLVGGWRAMPVETWTATDKSGWDWTAQAWLFELVLELRYRLCKNPSPKWLELAVWRYKALFSDQCRFITSGGLVLRQRRPGVMKSGCVNTISDNTLMQVILHLRVCATLEIPAGCLIGMGDDVLQETLDREEDYLDMLGQFCYIKQAAHINEFAGFRFSGKNVEPCYQGKHAYALLHVNEDLLPQICDSYLLLYHRSQRRDYLRSMFQEMDLEVRPLQWFDAIFDGI